MVPEGILGGLGGAIGWPGRQIQFWTPFSEKMCENPSVLHGLGAARRSEPDQPDLPDQADPGEMGGATAGPNPPSTRAGG